jgi:hypothetical protein
VNVSREFASPELANLIARRLSPEEFERRARAPLTEGEAQDIAELHAWFSRRYPTAKERLAYARRKLRQYGGVDVEAAVDTGYFATARRLARAHRQADPATALIFLEPDPERREIRLLEVTATAPPTAEPSAVGFAARPDLGIPFPSSIVLLSPDDWAAVRSDRVELCDGWNVARFEPL